MEPPLPSLPKDIYLHWLGAPKQGDTPQNRTFFKKGSEYLAKFLLHGVENQNPQQTATDWGARGVGGQETLSHTRWGGHHWTPPGPPIGTGGGGGRELRPASGPQRPPTPCTGGNIYNPTVWAPMCRWFTRNPTHPHTPGQIWDAALARHPP